MTANRFQQFQDLLILLHVDDNLPPLESYQLTPAQYAYIDYISRHEPLSLTQLTEGLGFRPSTVSVMVKNLESKSLLIKSENQVDKRSCLLSLTSAGRQIFEKVNQFRQVRARKLLNKLTEDEADQFLSLFRKLIN